MNKDLLNQLPTEEQPVAFKLDSLAKDMKLSQSFQWDLENQLMEVYPSKTDRAKQGWFMKMLVPIAWAVAAVFAVFLLSWMIRSLTPASPPAAGVTSTPEISFENSVRQGNICAGPLALAHGFDIFLTDEHKTIFTPLNTTSSIGEVRSFAWSADGKRLAVIGNTTGSGTIYITGPSGGQMEYVLSGSEVGYLWDAAWSHDGRQFVIWSSSNNALYLLNSDGTGLVKQPVGVQILGTPQFSPNGKSIVFYGADTNSIGLYEMKLNNPQVTLINPSVEDESGFAFSPDGSLLAYLEYDRDGGEARLFTANATTGERALLGILSIPRNPGASLPDSAHLSWSADGKFLVFDHGHHAVDRAVYLAPVDGTGIIKIAESAHVPSISSDGRCLAYISDKQVFLLDLNNISSPSGPVPVLLADLPVGRGVADLKLDKLQWRP